MKPSFPLVAVLLLAATSTLPAAEAQKPNILVLYADDLGYGDDQCNNRERGKCSHAEHDYSASTIG